MAHEWGKITRHERFHRIAKDLDWAFRLADLTKAEQVVIGYMIEHSWTLPYTRRPKGDKAAAPDPAPVKISRRGLASLAGMDRANVRDAVKSLVTARILIETGEGAYLINKQADQWRDRSGLSPRLTKEEIACCVESVSRKGWGQRTPGGGGVNGPQGASEPQGGGVNGPQGGGVNGPQGGGVNGPQGGGVSEPHCTNASPGTPDIEAPARVLDSRKMEKKIFSDGGPPAAPEKNGSRPQGEKPLSPGMAAVLRSVNRHGRKR